MSTAHSLFHGEVGGACQSPPLLPGLSPKWIWGAPPPLRHCAAKAISGYPAACISCPPPPQLLQGDRKGRMEPNGLGREQGLQALGGAGESQLGNGS